MRCFADAAEKVAPEGGEQALAVKALSRRARAVERAWVALGGR